MDKKMNRHLVVDLRKIEKKRTFKKRMFGCLNFFSQKKVFFLAFLLAAIFIAQAFFQLKHQESEMKIAFSSTIEEGKLDREVYHLPEKSFPRGLNLVFLADDYSSWEDFDNDVTMTMEGLKNFSPWKEYQSFNVYKVKPNKPEEKLCRVKTENERKPVLRCDDAINTYLNQLTLAKFRLVVLSRKDFQSWANLTRGENGGIFFSVPKKIEPAEGYGYGILFAHLIGHSFGLKDEEEFVIAKAGGAPHTPDGPNCAPDKETAKLWWGDLATKKPEQVGYFQTCCGNQDYIKPTESSIMNLADNMEKFNPSYGPVSERYLQTVLEICFSPERKLAVDYEEFLSQFPEWRSCF